MITIGKAQVRDLSEIHALLKSAFLTEAERTGNFEIAPLKETLADLTAVLQTITLLVLRVDGKIVGTIRGHVKDGTLHVGRLAVHPDFRKRGLGAQLIAAMETAHPEAKRCEIFTSEYSTDNIRLYGKHGYKEFARKGTVEGVTLVLMEKQR